LGTIRRLFGSVPRRSTRGAAAWRSQFPGLIAAIAVTTAAAAASQPPTAPTAAAAPAHTSIAFIVNAQNPVGELSVAELRRILLGETTRWPDGRRITVAMRDSGQAERDAVLRLVCSMSDQDFSRYLLQATFRGTLQSSPKVLETPTGVRRFVFNVPGAIGYVRTDEVDASVKMVRITGAVSAGPAFGLTLPIR
jgi:ABC-type phosphate transport system substrate-binding protein